MPTFSFSNRRLEAPAESGNENSGGSLKSFDQRMQAATRDEINALQPYQLRIKNSITTEDDLYTVQMLSKNPDATRVLYFLSLFKDTDWFKDLSNESNIGRVTDILMGIVRNRELSNRIHCGAVQYLGKILGAKCIPYLKEIISMDSDIDDEFNYTKQSAVYELGKLSKTNTLEILPILRQALLDKSIGACSVRDSSAVVIGRMGTSAAKAWPELISAIELEKFPCLEGVRSLALIG